MDREKSVTVFITPFSPTRKSCHFYFCCEGDSSTARAFDSLSAFHVQLCFVACKKGVCSGIWWKLSTFYERSPCATRTTIAFWQAGLLFRVWFGYTGEICNQTVCILLEYQNNLCGHFLDSGIVKLKNGTTRPSSSIWTNVEWVFFFSFLSNHKIFLSAHAA
jgi:hypothetical protein